MEHSPPIEFHLLVGLVPDQTARTALIPSGDDGMRCRACFENPQFCDAWHIDGFPEDYFELGEREPEPSGEKKCSALKSSDLSESSCWSDLSPRCNFAG
jgi:hypothetical protein